MATTISKSQVALSKLQEEQTPLLKWLASAHVSSAEEQKDAENLLISARFALRQAEATRKGFQKPITESRNNINNLFRPYIARLESGISSLNTVLHAWHTSQVKAAETSRIAALAIEAARIAPSHETGELPPPLAAPAAAALLTPSAPKTSRTNMGSVSYIKSYEIEIVRADLVPRDLCEPSLTKIRARVNSGILDIPGCFISEKLISSTRVANQPKSLNDAYELTKF